MKELNEIVANNLITYRKQLNLTQAELAEKLNYSDKSVSKWERGEGIPDVAVLKKLADLYKVSVNDFLVEKPISKIRTIASNRKHAIISLLSVATAWFIATVVYVGLHVFKVAVAKWAWLAFIYAIPVSAILLIIFSALWSTRNAITISTSLLAWSFVLSMFLSVPILHNWLVFLVPTVAQIIIIIWHVLKKTTINTN